MAWLDSLIERVSPGLALSRARQRAALSLVKAHYAAATPGNRGKSWRASGADADAAAGRRARLAAISRDMIRNTPLATRAQMVITNNVVGDGIIPKVTAGSGKIPDRLKTQLNDLIVAHLDTVAIDADGRCNLYGLQRLVMNSLSDAGEVLIRHHRRGRRDGLPLPFQIQVLEADYLDTSKEGAVGDGYIHEGIEFDQIGRRVAYWLFDQHPGTVALRPRGYTSRRVPASEILHIYRQDRPGQRRGVTWFAPVAMKLQDLDDGLDAHLMRQKIAACFAGFVRNVDAEPGDAIKRAALTSIIPGRIQELGPGEEISFPSPPPVEGHDEFSRTVIRQVAAGLGITYEALSGDLTNVNFTSYKVGQLQMNRNISSWQWLLMIPQFCDPLARWFLEAAALQIGRPMPDFVRLGWVPPAMVMVDPTREIPAMIKEVRAGFASRQGQIRKLGHDPEEIEREQVEDQQRADENGLSFETDVRKPASAGGADGHRKPAVDR